MQFDTTLTATRESGALPFSDFSPGAALQGWAATGEGARLWAATCPQFTVERVCHALTHTRAIRFGLLLTNQGAIIWSRFSPQSFSRLQGRYEEVAAGGLCFWCDGSGLLLVGAMSFLTLVRTLPAPTHPRHGTAPDGRFDRL